MGAPLTKHMNIYLTCSLRYLSALTTLATSMTGFADEVVQPNAFIVTPHIEKILDANCYACHDEWEQKGDLRLDQLESLTLGNRLNVMNRMQENVHFKEMPPRKEKEQPTDAERATLIKWLSGELKKHKASTLEGKLRMPKYANYVNHQKLFSGEYSHLKAFTPDRRWLISEYIFEDKFNKLLDYKHSRRIDGKQVQILGSNARKGINLTNPFLLAGDSGVRYYDTTTLEGGHLLTMITNARVASIYMMDKSKKGGYLPVVKQIMADQWQREKTLNARQELVNNWITRILEDIYKDKNQVLFPKFVPVTVKAQEPNKGKKKKGKKSKNKKDQMSQILRSAPDKDLMYHTLLKHQKSAKSDKELIYACEREWSNYGENSFVIEARVTFLSRYLKPWRESMAKRRLKQQAYKPLASSEMDTIRQTILKLRKQGDTCKAIVSKCKADWEQHLKLQQVAESTVSEVNIDALVGELFNKILGREPDSKDLEKYAQLTHKYFKILDKESAIKKLIGTMILSSEFVYRYEFGVGEPDQHGRRMLSSRDASYAIAYALTDSSPDEELAEAARNGKLNTREDFKREVQRLLKKRSQYYVIDNNLGGKKGAPSFTNMPIRELRFFREFFGYPKMLSIFKDNKRFGGLYIQSSPRILSEADMLVEHILNKDKNVFKELLTTDKFYVFHSGDNDAMGAASDNLRKIYDYFKDKKWQGLTIKEMEPHRDFLKGVGMEEALSKTGKNLRFFEDSISSIIMRFDKGQKNAPPYSPRPQVGPLGLLHATAVKSYNIDLTNWDYPTTQPAALPNRKGILTHPAWLIAYARNTETDPIHRGIWIREKLLAGSIPATPITVDAVVPEDHTKTVRSRVATATEAKYCWTCHEHMNPLGYAFEMFDDFGRFRTQEPLEHPDNLIKSTPHKGAPHLDLRDLFKTLPVDARGHLAGTDDKSLDGDVENALDLVERLGQSSKVRQSIIRHAFRYFMGRNETLADSRTLIEADQAYLKSDGSFDALIVSLLTSDSFIYRKSTKK